MGLTGLTLEEAESALLGSRLRLGKVSQVFDEEVANGLVIGPSTLITELPTGSEVDLNISSGPELRVVPNSLVGDIFESAETAIVLEGLQVRKLELFHPNISSGVVIGLNPEPGTPIMRDGIVEIFVSKGPETTE
jgi:serine/threonine-protein kinase